MDSIARHLRRRDWFARRRDLLASGYTDAHIRAALRAHTIFRVRQGWYSVPDAPEAAIRAVRVGGRLAGVAVLESYGLRVPRRELVDVVVAANACRLRDPGDRARRLPHNSGVRVHWDDGAHGGSVWRTSLDDALALILRTESRDIAVACASAIMRYQGWSRRRLEKIFREAPEHARAWVDLVSDQDEAHGETFARLWYLDAGIPCESQPRIGNGRRLDLRVGPNTYVEIDGAQHDPLWTGEGGSSRHTDVATDVYVASRGGSVLRFDYAMLYGQWAECLAATRRAIADDVELVARRRRHPAVPNPVRALWTAAKRAGRRRS